jgi:hypothetical protein
MHVNQDGTQRAEQYAKDAISCYGDDKSKKKTAEPKTTTKQAICHIEAVILARQLLVLQDADWAVK